MGRSRRFLFCGLFLVTLVLGASRADAQYVQLRNRWKPKQILHVNSGKITAGALNQGWTSGHWQFVPVDTHYVRIVNRWRPRMVLNIEHGVLSASDAKPAYHSSHWKIVPVGGYWFRLQNRWKPKLFLHIEYGRPMATAIPAAYWSSHWAKVATPTVTSSSSACTTLPATQSSMVCNTLFRELRKLIPASFNGGARITGNALIGAVEGFLCESLNAVQRMGHLLPGLQLAPPKPPALCKRIRDPFGRGMCGLAVGELSQIQNVATCVANVGRLQGVQFNASCFSYELAKSLGKTVFWGLLFHKIKGKLRGPLEKAVNKQIRCYGHACRNKKKFLAQRLALRLLNSKTVKAVGAARSTFVASVHACLGASTP